MAREHPSDNVDVDDTLAIGWGPASYETYWWTLTYLLTIVCRCHYSYGFPSLIYLLKEYSPALILPLGLPAANYSPLDRCRINLSHWMGLA